MTKEKPPLTLCSPTMATTKVCRLCGTKDVPFLNIFGTGMNLASKIEELLFIEVKEWDDLPHKICFRCSTKVTEFHEFLEKCVSTQGQFTKLLGKPYTFKREKNTSARKNWEAKLNKSKLSNDQYCEELVKKALESVAMLKPFSSKDEAKLKTHSLKTVLNRNFKHPCTKNVKIILKRVDSPNFPGVKIIGNGTYLISENLKQLTGDPKSCDQKKTYSDENVDSSRASNLIKYKCHQCNEIIEDKAKVASHVCKTSLPKETPVNTVNPIKRSKATTKTPVEVNDSSPCDIINLDDDDCVPKATFVRKNNKPDAVSNEKNSTILGKNFHLLDMLVPQSARDSAAKPTLAIHSGKGQIVPISLPSNCCLVPMADNTFTIQMIPQESQGAIPVMQNSINFQNKIFSGGQYFMNNVNYMPTPLPMQQNSGELNQFVNHNLNMPSNQDSHTGIRYALEMSQTYHGSLNSPSNQGIVSETISSERLSKRKSSSKGNNLKKMKQSAENTNSSPYPVSLLYRSTREKRNNTPEEGNNDSIKSSPNILRSKRTENPVYTISPAKNSDKPEPSSNSKHKDSSKSPLKCSLKKKIIYPTSAQCDRGMSQTQGAMVTKKNEEDRPQVTDGSFFTVVNVEPFFKPGNVPPMKICLKKSATQQNTKSVPMESTKKPNMVSENLAKKNENTFYSCSICDLEFSKEKRLLSHYKTHYEGFNDEEYL